jgi:phosphopantothenoylcysteine decarboxylase / phosphopantothenate---cysteine ligase
MLKSNTKPKILVLMSGSIACYKACGLVSMLVKNGYEVKVAASSSALKFIGEATIEGLTGQSVYSDLWKKGSAMEHIHLERWADLIVAAPGSAHFINRIAHGIGDDLLSTIFLAHEFKKPFLIAPAMNTAMYLNPVTQKSLETLKGFGIKILEAASGVLACGETGYGKLLEPDLLFKEIQNSLDTKINDQIQMTSKRVDNSKKSKKVLITAGGTREAIDDVRYITNSSSGITGEKIASTLSELGFDVTLDLAESSTVKPTDAYQLKHFDSFLSLSDLLKAQLAEENYDLVIHAAAVSDFTVDKTVGKMSSSEDLTLNFKRNPKLVNSVKTWSKNKNVKLIAFKLTSKAADDQVKNKVLKVMEEAHADAVVQNDIKSLEDRKNHQFKIFSRNQTVEAIGVEELVSEIVKVGQL